MKSLLFIFSISLLTSCTAQKVSNTATSRDGSLALFESKHEENTIYVTRDGNMGIGKKKPKDKLEVNGQIHARSVKVDLKEWADTVFKKDYKLTELDLVEAYIKAHGHLPEIPAAAVVLEEGIELGEMNKLLLKKIEELTLYLIAQNKELLALKKEMKTLTSEKL